MRRLLMLVAAIVSAEVCAQTSQFSHETDGTAQPVPILVREDLQRDRGRAEIVVTPSQIISMGQHFLRTSGWGFWFWTNELHMMFTEEDGTRRLVRLKDASADPLPGTEVVAGQTMNVELSWSPAGVGVLVDGEVRTYLEGSFLPPDDSLTYGASPGGERPFVGSLSVSVYAEPGDFDPCDNYPEHGEVQTFSPSGQTVSNEVPPEPTCRTVPDDEPETVVNGVATTDLSWTRPTENEDGSILLAGEIDTYAIYFGDQSRVGRCADRPSVPRDDTCYPNAMIIGGELETEQAVFSVEKDSVVYFAMSTITLNDENEDLISRYSNEIGRRFEVNVEDVPDSEPNPPTDFTVTITVTAECETPSGVVVPCSVDVLEVE